MPPAPSLCGRALGAIPARFGGQRSTRKQPSLDRVAQRSLVGVVALRQRVAQLQRVRDGVAELVVLGVDSVLVVVVDVGLVDREDLRCRVKVNVATALRYVGVWRGGVSRLLLSSQARSWARKAEARA